VRRCLTTVPGVGAVTALAFKTAVDEPARLQSSAASVVTEGSRSIGNHAASEIDAPGPCRIPTCGGRPRRPRTEEWPLPDDHPRSQLQLEVLDPRRPITEEGFDDSSFPSRDRAAARRLRRPRRRAQGDRPTVYQREWRNPLRMVSFFRIAQHPTTGRRTSGTSDWTTSLEFW